MKVGRSLSFCVRDIAKGKVKYDDVEFIVCGTAFKDLDGFEKVVIAYAESYWRECKLDAIEVAIRLHRAGKLIQPRLQGCAAPSVAASHWMEVS